MRTIVTVLLLWIAGLTAGAQFAKIAVPYASVQSAYPNIGVELGWLLSLVSFVGALLGVVAGGLVTRVGAKRALIVGLFIGSICSIWQSGVPSFEIMLVTRLVEGCSHLAIVVAAPTLIVQISAERYRGYAMALWSSFFGVSFALTTWFGNGIVPGNELVSLFLWHGVLMTVIAVGLLAMFKWAGYVDHDVSADEKIGVLQQHIRAYRSPDISAPGLGWLFYTLTYVSLLAILPIWLSAEGQEWVVVGMPLISVLISLIVVPLLLGTFTSVTLVKAGFLCALFSAVLLLTVVPLSVVAITLFASLGIIQGSSFASVPVLNSSAGNQALSYGVMAQMGNVGNLLGTPLLLFALGDGNKNTLFVTIISLYLMGYLVHRILEVRRSQSMAPGHSGCETQ